MTEKPFTKQKLAVQRGENVEETEFLQPLRSRSSMMRDKVLHKLKEQKSQTGQSSSKTLLMKIQEPQRNTTKKESVSEDQAYRFFCHEFNKLPIKESLCGKVNEKRDIDTVINIEDIVEFCSPLVPGEIVNLVTDPSILFVPSNLPVPHKKTVAGNIRPRFIEDEGMYVSERPQVPWKMRNKMENRLLEQNKGVEWFGENGCMTVLADPVDEYWRFKVDFPFASQSHDVTTVFMKPMKMGAALSKTECSAGMWQLDLHIAELLFTHHPLFSKEHVLAQKLSELYEHFKNRQIAGMSTALNEKLRGLKISAAALKSSAKPEAPNPNPVLMELRQQIRKTRNTLNKEKQADQSLVKKIIAAWNSLKNHRVKAEYVSTNAKLLMHRVMAVSPESANPHGDTGELTKTDEATFRQHLMSNELVHLEEEIHEQERSRPIYSACVKPFDMIPVLSKSGLVTPTLNCPPDEKVRRAALECHKVSVNIYYNGKHVSTSEQASIDSDFRVNIQQMFNMQIIHSPESILLEICEHVKQRSAVVAKVYLPIPDRNMLSSNAYVERSEFSCDQVVQPHFEGVGSNVPFRLAETEPEVHLLTSGKLTYSVFWAVDEIGFPLAPVAPRFRPSFTRAMTSCTNENWLAWIKDLEFDPNHPGNTELAELLKAMREQQNRAQGHFRLNALEEEFDFTTEEQLDKSRRFNLLKLRSSHRMEISPSKAIPLHDRNITESMFAEYASHSLFLNDEDPITAQRFQTIHCIERLLNLARKKLLDIKKKYKFSDIVHEYQDIDEPMEFNFDMFRRRHPLNPKRVARKSTASTTAPSGDLKICVAINNARGLPIRQEAPPEEMHTRGSCCGLPNNRHHTRRHVEKAPSRAPVQPFVVVKFQETTQETQAEQGPNPCWREEFTFHLKAKGGDYSFSSLSNVEDSMIISVFDQCSFQVIESSSLGGCGTQVFSSRQRLGSVTLPFRTLLQRSKVCEPLTIRYPSLLLGYTWTDKDGVTEQAIQVEDRENSYLDVFITLDPPIFAAADLTAKEEDQKSLWLFSSVEEERLLNRSSHFKRRWRAASGGRQRIVTTVINSEGALVLATRFFRPIPPPQDVLRDVPHLGIAALETLATFVSLIPVLSFPSNIGDHGDMWFTSEQCLELAVGNSVSLAVLLCNFFHHLKIDAWLLLGTSVLEGETEYVLSRMDAKHLLKEAKEDTEIQRTARYGLWNPRDGTLYSLCDTQCPLQTVDCLVNGQNVWVNSQHEKRTPVLNFDLCDRASWSSLFPDGFESAASSAPVGVRYIPTQAELVIRLQRRLEVSLKNSVMEWRSPHPTRWSPRCSSMLSDVLCKLERNPASFAVQEGIDRMLDTMKDYKVIGFPIRMAYKDIRSVSDAVYNTGFHSTEIPGTEFALAVYIHPYPNHILSVWIFLATLVKHQHGTFYVPAELEF